MYDISRLIVAFATLIGAFGGFPKPPKIFVKMASYQIVQWLLVFTLLYQGGSGQDVILAAMITVGTFLIYKLVHYFEGSDDDLVF